MQLGMIGLGKMGGNMVTRLVRGGHQIVAYDRSPDAVKAAGPQGAVGAASLPGLGSKLNAPRAVWVMVAAGAPTEDTVKALAGRKHGAGHFVKMVHNGIEYAMMQAYAEGFDIMKATDFNLDLAAIGNLWMQGSVVRSWLLDLGAEALKKNPTLEGIKPFVNDSGEG